MASSDINQNPFNAIPLVVVALVAILLGIELIFQAGARGFAGSDGIGWRLEALNAFAFSPQLWDRMVETGQFPPRALLRFVTYSFVHLSFGHMLFVLVFLLALGKMVAEAFSALAVLAVLAVSSIVGALVYAAALSPSIALVGGYPAVYGLIGAYTFILWTGLGTLGEQRMRAFTLIALLMGIQLLFGLMFGGGPEWVADLGGFCAGFALSFVVSPGGFGRVLDKLRQR
ncbi:rhomboid family intramembrane serine protease [Maribius pontilimi]|uniref:Rhomboid family intramembrane serine protease n=1 Tax=Palleronia pontilimi TaxID=1964209 RepID=A0A934IHW4_9RHOB|nr:rhomboid family intramembrane serine protease [Palleronia pontilimi]MBJ3763362.1 rhomboid family intramembrane serine protease [Palleronia pontilimi]